MKDIPADLLKRAADNDIASFESIYRETSDFVYNVAYRVLHSKEEAEEVTQEVFLKVYHNLKYFRLESSFKTWIYRIAVNSAINYLKKSIGEKNRMQEYCGYITREETAESRDAAFEAGREKVKSLLRVLNPDQKMCIVLRNIEGLSYQEIADVLKISINTVRTRLKRAREKMLSVGKEVIRDGV